jgi:hypothetical protein
MRDQIPFAMSRVMNDAAFISRNSLVKETWPQHVKQKQPTFPGVVLHVNRSTKENLRVEINESDVKRASLKEHAEGGVRTPASRRFAIPLPWYRQMYSRAQGGLQKSRTSDSLSKFCVVDGRLILRTLRQNSAPHIIMRPMSYVSWRALVNLSLR